MRFSTIMRLCGGGVLFLGLLAVGACVEGNGWNGKASSVPMPARHAVHTEQLKKVMSELGASVASTWPQEIQQDVKDDRGIDYKAAEDLARLLAKTTRILPEAVKDTEMSSDDREVFMANVDLLAFQATQLEASAREHRIREMRGVLNQIQTTCYGCHSQFRGEPGPLKFGN